MLLRTVFSASLVAFSVANAKEPAQPSLLPIEQMRAVAYTKDFAKRFALPDPELGSEPSGGVQGMEFAVEPGPRHGRGLYYCKLKLYLDNTLPLAYPEEGVAGADHMLRQSSHFFMWPNPENKRWLSLPEKDRLHFNERNGRYNRKSLLATPDYNELNRRGAGVGMFYEEYHRDLFPGLAYLKIDMACPAYSWVDKVEVVQIWLEREGGKDYRKQLREDPNDFFKFTIPQLFYRKIVTWTKEVAGYNSTIIQEQARQRREAKTR